MRFRKFVIFYLALELHELTAKDVVTVRIIAVKLAC